MPFEFSFPDTKKYEEYTEEMFDLTIDCHYEAIKLSPESEWYHQKEIRLLLIRKISLKYPELIDQL